jgi:hypothetical protein
VAWSMKQQDDEYDLMLVAPQEWKKRKNQVLAEEAIAEHSLALVPIPDDSLHALPSEETQVPLEAVEDYSSPGAGVSQRQARTLYSIADLKRAMIGRSYKISAFLKGVSVGKDTNSGVTMTIGDGRDFVKARVKGVISESELEAMRTNAELSAFLFTIHVEALPFGGRLLRHYWIIAVHL